MGYKMNNLKNNSLYDRVNKLLVSYDWSDCCFSVCGKKFRAHKLILGISSPVFEAMFYGPLSTNDDIDITDIEPNIFQLLLNYIYTDKVNIQSVEEAYDLLYVSRKYMLEYLTEICIEFIQSNISIDNVLNILNYPDYMQDNKLVSSALKLFCQHADYLLKENWNKISIICIQKLLKCNEINILEKDLINSVFNWTSHYCDINNISDNFQNRRDILIKSGLLKSLRFSSLSTEELDEISTSTNNILINSEVEDIRKFIKNSGYVNNKIIHFDNKLKPRKPLKLQWCLCHRTSIRSESPIVIDPNNLIINTRIKANKSVFINSISVPSRMTPVLEYCNNVTNLYNENFTISITCEQNDSILQRFCFNNNNINYDSNIDIKLTAPLLLKKNTWYKVTFMWPHLNNLNSYLYVVQSRDKIYDNGKILFEFEDILPVADNSGCFIIGLKYCM